MSAELSPLFAAIKATYAAQPPSKHSVLGPSSAYKWTACPASIAMEQAGGYKDSAGSSARKGTFQHFVSAYCLEHGHSAAEFIGLQETVEGEDFTFDKDMAELCQTYIDTVLSYVGDDGILFVEQQLDISWITGEEGAVGTADAIIVRNGELIVIDLKTGLNDVDAVENQQLTIYAAAALRMWNEGTLKAPAVQISTPPVTESAPADDGDDLL